MVSGRIAVVFWGVVSRTCSILLAAFLCSCRQVSVHEVHPYSSIDTISAWKKLRFILSVRSNFHITESLSIAVHAFASPMLMSVSVDETLLPLILSIDGGARGVMVIVVGIGHGNTSSNPGRIAFYIAPIPLGKV